MKRFLLPAIFAFGVCIISSPIQAAAPSVGMTATQPILSLIDNSQNFFGDPNVAYLFLTLAILGLLIEIITPSTYLPGIVGAIAAILACYALGLLSVNPLGLILIILALPLFIFGAYLTTLLIPFIIAGISALIIGSLYLFHVEFSIHPALIAAVVVITSGAFIIISNRVVKAQRLSVTTGPESLFGHTATVRTPLEPSGTVMVEGELWQADLNQGKAQTGEDVIVTAINGLRLIVTKKKQGGA